MLGPPLVLLLLLLAIGIRSLKLVPGLNSRRGSAGGREEEDEEGVGSLAPETAAAAATASSLGPGPVKGAYESL